MVWIINGIQENIARTSPEGDFEEREQNPDLNTNDWDQH